MVLTLPKRLLLGLTQGLSTSVKDIKPFLYPKEETWRNPIIYHIFSCAFLYKITATARLINKMIEGLLYGLRPPVMAEIISLQLDSLTPPEQDDCTKIVCWGPVNP